MKPAIWAGRLFLVVNSDPAVTVSVKFNHLVIAFNTISTRCNPISEASSDIPPLHRYALYIQNGVISCFSNSLYIIPKLFQACT